MENANKQISFTRIATILLYGSVILIAFYSLGFFTNLVQVRGADRELYDLYQDFVRSEFNLSLAGIVLMVYLRISGFRLKLHRSFIQSATGIALGTLVLGLSIYGLMKLPGFHELYEVLNLEDVRMFYPSYEYGDSVFTYGYVIYVLTAIVSTASIATHSAGVFGRKGGRKI